MQTEKGVSSQIWKFERQSDNSYKIINTLNGQCLDLLNFVTDNSNNIQTCPDNNSNAQRWYLVPANGGYCFITKCGLSKAMDLESNNTTDGINISIYDRNNSDAQIFSVYAGNDVQLQVPSLSVISGSSQNKTLINWTDTYGESGYQLKIWNEEVSDTDAYYSDCNISQNTLSAEVNLPAGSYETYIDAVNYFERKRSDTVKFTVAPEVSVFIDKIEATINLEWDEVLKANSYTVNVYSDDDNLVQSTENIKNNNYSFQIDNGEYYLTVMSDNNVCSIKKYFIVNNNYLKAKIGDVNFDGYITMDDADLIMKYNVGKVPVINKTIADVNRDGVINVNDVLILGKYLSGENVGYVGQEMDILALLGDANIDNYINIADATEIQKYLVGFTTFTDEHKKLADTNADGIINIKDSTLIQKYLAGLVSSLG